MKEKKGFGVMNVILVIVAVVLLCYTAIVLYIYFQVGSEPSALTYSLFGVATGELGIMGWIKNGKDKVREREWALEDREREKGKK